MKKKSQQPQSRQPKTNFWQGAEFPLAVAHRGGDAAGFGKRNTMVAFESAHKLGYKYMETDVVVTKDDQVIIAHGAKNKLAAAFRGTFSDRTFRNLTYQEVKQKLKVDGEPIPLLREVLVAFPDTKFFVDPKTNSVVKPLADLLIELKALDRVLIYSFEYHRLMTLQRLLDNKAELGLSIDRHPSLIYKFFRLRIGKLSHLEVINMNFWFASHYWIKHIHRQGLNVIVWTPNSDRAIKRVINNRTDAIISDRIKLLKQLLEKDTTP